MDSIDESELLFDPAPFGGGLAERGAQDRELLEGAQFAGLTAAEQKAIAITSTLETGKRGSFYGLSGDFDGMGLSFGLVNWTIGTGSLQPLLRDFAKAHPDRWLATFGTDAQRFLTLIQPQGAAAQKSQLAFAKSEMNQRCKIRHKGKLVETFCVKEPWQTYFKKLAADREFQLIEVRYVRDLLDRARYFCELFGLRSERAFCFMFDAVSSHGKWWLTKKNKARVEYRNDALKKKLAALASKRGGASALTERDKLEAVAETLRDTSSSRWAAKVYERKMWFLTGKHRRAAELAGLEPTDAAYASSGTGGGAPPVASPPRAGGTAATSAGASAKLTPAMEDAIVTPLVLALIVSGERNADKLASEAFYVLNSQRHRRPIAKEETAQANQWRRLRSGVVARLLAKSGGSPVAAPRATSNEVPGTTLYFPIEVGDEAPASPSTGVYFPPGFRAASELDIIVYLHGHKAGHYPRGAEMGIDRYWAPATNPRAALREAVAQSGKQVALVAPTLGPQSQAKSLVAAGAFDRYLGQVFAALARSTPFAGRPAPKLRNLVLAAHSGGGIGMLRLAQGTDRAVRDNLRECWGFDCFYNPKLEQAGWPAWARTHADKRLYAYYATDLCEKGVCVGPKTVARALAKNAPKNLVMLPAKRPSHFAVLEDHFAERVRAAPFLE